MTAVNRLLKLPTDVRNTYFSCLMMKELCILSSVCRSFLAFTKNLELWTKRYQKEHPLAVCKNPRATFQGAFLAYETTQQRVTTPHPMLDCSLQRNGSFIGAIQDNSKKVDFAAFDRNGKKIQSLQTPNYALKDNLVRFSRRPNHFLAAVVGSNSSFIWDTRTWQLIANIRTINSTLSPVVLESSSALLMDATMQLDFDWIECINLFDWKTGRCKVVFQTDGELYGFDVFGTNLLAATQRDLQIWDIETTNTVARKKCSFPQVNWVTSANSTTSFVTMSYHVDTTTSSIQQWDLRMSGSNKTFLVNECLRNLTCQDFVLACTSQNKTLFYDIRRDNCALELPAEGQNSLQFYGDGIMTHTESHVIFRDFNPPQTAKRTCVLAEMPVAKKAKTSK